LKIGGIGERSKKRKVLERLLKKIQRVLKSRKEEEEEHSLKTNEVKRILRDP
jgi:hypothetical protein